MATGTITLSKEAPQEKIRFSLANDSFDLDADGKYKSSDPAVLSNAEAHPWLTVAYPEVDAFAAYQAHVETVKYEDDPLSAVNSIANDPEAAKAALVEAETVVHTAIESGLDQNKAKKVGEVNVTIAADAKETDKADKGDK